MCTYINIGQNALQVDLVSHGICCLGDDLTTLLHFPEELQLEVEDADDWSEEFKGQLAAVSGLLQLHVLL